MWKWIRSGLALMLVTRVSAYAVAIRIESIGEYSPPKNWPMFLLGVAFAAGVALAQDTLKKAAKAVFGGMAETAYRLWAPRIPRLSLRNYRKHLLRSDIGRIEIPVGPVPIIPIEKAFVKLKVVSAGAESDFFQLVCQHDRLMVLGAAGTGKTTLMKSLVVDVLNGDYANELQESIPVLLMLRRMAMHDQSVEDAIISAFAEHKFPRAGNFVRSCLDAGKFLIILDGLDEVGVNRESVLERLRDFCRVDDPRERRNRIVVTCREAAYRIQYLRDVVPTLATIEPFSNFHIKRFLVAWPAYQGRRTDTLYSQLQDEPRILDICRNPLMLTILTGLFLESNDFRLPKSRDHFYELALGELLVQRPARRNQKQEVSASEKIRILGRISLGQIRSVSTTDDPEELTLDALKIQADALNSGIKVSVLISELTEINGVLRVIGDGRFTYAHRTIQEYLAAGEAHHQFHNVGEIVDMVTGRPEITEVLVFFCGMLHNIPQVTEIILRLAKESQWVSAARCLLAARELPETQSLYSIIASGLASQIADRTGRDQALLTLSSLAHRDEPQFEPFDIEFQRIVRGWLTAGDASGHDLSSALGTNPDFAMQLMPALLERFPAEAVGLLRDVGTDDALDQLVRLLESPKQDLRVRAASMLDSMLVSRRADLVVRAGLLPERHKAMLWPMEDYLPGNLALPMALALVGETRSDFFIDAAAEAIGQIEQKSSKRRHEHPWLRVERDMRRWQARRTIALTLAHVLWAAVLFGGLWITWVSEFRHIKEFTILQLWPPKISLADTDPLLHVRKELLPIVGWCSSRHSEGELKIQDSQTSRVDSFCYNFQSLYDPDDYPAETLEMLSNHLGSPLFKNQLEIQFPVSQIQHMHDVAEQAHRVYATAMLPSPLLTVVGKSAIPTDSWLLVMTFIFGLAIASGALALWFWNKGIRTIAFGRLVAHAVFTGVALWAPLSAFTYGAFPDLDAGVLICVLLLSAVAFRADWPDNPYVENVFAFRSNPSAWSQARVGTPKALFEIAAAQRD